MRYCLILGVVVSQAACCIAARGTVVGRDSDWRDEQRRLCVLVARVVRVESVKHDPANPKPTHRATLKPIATLAGEFDPSGVAELPVTFYVGTLGTNLTIAPASGSLIMGVLEITKDRDSGMPKSGFILSDICPFMPDGESSITVLKDMGDTRVMETSERLRSIRKDSVSNGKTRVK